MLVIMLVAAVPRVGTAQTPASSPDRDSTSNISARLTDHETGQPIQGAIVRLFSGVGREERVRTRVTNRDGRFFFSHLPGGRYALVAGRLGYRNMSDSVAIPSGEDLQLRLQLSSYPVELDPVLVVVTPPTTRAGPVPGLAARERRGIGTILDRKEIEDVHPFEVSDLFRTIPGVRVMPDQDLGYRLELHGGCKPVIWVDGTRTSADDVDLFLRPSDLQAVEVYQAAEVPARYSGNSCGAVLFWTRPAEKANLKFSSFWKKLIIPAAILAALIVHIR
jgi:hypothetical protein